MSEVLQVTQVAVGGFDHNFSYIILAADGECALVDPTGDTGLLRQKLAEAGEIKPRYILLTHSHHDHTAGIPAVKKFFPADVYAHPLAGYPGQRSLAAGEWLPLGTSGIEVMYTPGHSPDSVCYLLPSGGGIFTGDTLFIGCCGYCEPEQMFASLQKLKTLSPAHIIYSGHDYGDVAYETLGEQMRRNPCLTPADMRQFKKALRDI